MRGDFTMDPGFEMPVASTPPTQPAMPPSKPRRDLADLVRHVVVTEVQPGDALVFEVDHSLTAKELESFKAGVREGVTEDVRVMVVERGRFAGVIRHAAQPKPRCKRLDCDHKYCESAKEGNR